MQTITQKVPVRKKTAAMPPTYWAFGKLVTDSNNPELTSKRNRLTQGPLGRKYLENRTALIDRVLTEIATELNLLTRRFGSHEAAMNAVGPKYGIDKPLLKKLYYDVGAPAQMVLQFDLQRGERSHAMTLRTQLQAAKTAGKPWAITQQELIDKAATLKTKDPAHQQTIMQAITQAQTYERADAALLNLHLAMTGMRAAAEQATIRVAFTLPWAEKDWVAKTQRQARSLPIEIHGNSKGLYVTADHRTLDAAGLTRRISRLSHQTPRTRVIELTRTRLNDDDHLTFFFADHLSGQRTAEIHTATDPQTAGRLAADLVKQLGYDQVLVTDRTGCAHKCQKCPHEHHEEETQVATAASNQRPNDPERAVDTTLKTMTLDDLKWHRDGYQKVVDTGKDARGQTRTPEERDRFKNYVQDIDEEIKRRKTSDQ